MTETVAQWCAAHRAPYIPVIPAKVGRAYKASYGTLDYPQWDTVLQPESYLAQINGGGFVTPSEVVFAGEAVLVDPRCADRDKWFDKVVPNVGCDAAVRLETGILLQDTYDGNYGHLLMEVLPRLALLCDVPITVPLLVGKNVLGIPQLAQALEMCAQGRPVIPTEEGVGYTVDRLFVVGGMTWFPHVSTPTERILPGDFVFSSEGVSWMRTFQGEHSPEKLIYVDRKNDRIRMTNRDEVRQVFERAGFTTVYPEEMGLLEQRWLFAQARVVAGELGSGLTNMLWAPPTAAMICMIPFAPFDANPFVQLCGHAGQRVALLVGDADPSAPYWTPFAMDIPALETALAAIIKEV
jgi:capsular polysaccharide biosynthesis protein